MTRLSHSGRPHSPSVHLSTLRHGFSAEFFITAHLLPAALHGFLPPAVSSPLPPLSWCLLPPPSCPLLSTWPISLFTHLFSTFLPYRAERSRGWQKDDDPEQRRLDWKPGVDAAHLSHPSSPSSSPTGTGGIIASLLPQPSSAPALLLWFSKHLPNNAVGRHCHGALMLPNAALAAFELRNHVCTADVEWRPH